MTAVFHGGLYTWFYSTSDETSQFRRVILTVYSMNHTEGNIIANETVFYAPIFCGARKRITESV